MSAPFTCVNPMTVEDNYEDVNLPELSLEDLQYINKNDLW